MCLHQPLTQNVSLASKHEHEAGLGRLGYAGSAFGQLDRTPDSTTTLIARTWNDAATVILTCRRLTVGRSHGTRSIC